MPAPATEPTRAGEETSRPPAAVKARESAIAAETRAEALVTGALDYLHSLNNELLELHEAIRSAQPVASGSVCLELYPCGRGCLGCPHPRWVKYFWTTGERNPGILIATNLGAQHRDPVLALARKEPHYKQTVALIRRAKAILDERSRLLAALRSLRHASK